MDDNWGVRKLSAKVFSEVNYSFERLKCGRTLDYAAVVCL